MNWLEWILSHLLLRVSEGNRPGLDNFWLNQGSSLLLSFTHSAQEEVQERAATALATFVVIDDENASIDTGRSEAVMRDGGIHLLLNLARSWREGLQSEAAKATANLSLRSLGTSRGVAPLIALARSDAEDVHETAAGALWNLAFNPGNALRIVEEGGVSTLVHLCSSSVSKMAHSCLRWHWLTCLMEGTCTSS
ncbi:unnamed protein product [Fraxinus pennsylvanica]|uniref:Uncharacterized protein n=1 Tax=Fraxinus pennsylvanica TaxID=56036 RepID=A0AAD2EGD4_9LAMI|nr:unnamed protein product [Fraxinus pennsylvanica]